jgi:hypothetical protein
MRELKVKRMAFGTLVGCVAEAPMFSVIALPEAPENEPAAGTFAVTVSVPPLVDGAV